MSESNGEATTPATTAATVDPAPPDEFVKAAKVAPNHWLYLVDPTWRGEAAPPEFAVVGQWRSDDDGEIVEWQANEDCVPSPGARGWHEPTGDVDRVIQLATTGYGPAVVPIHTSPRYLHRTGPLGFEQVWIADVLDRIPEGHNLCVNSSAEVSMVLTPVGLAAADSAPAEETDRGERAEAVQAEATSAGAREEREERGGQA